MDFPTPDSVAEWDDASLFATTGYHASMRELRDGFETLTEAERVLCCLSLLDNEVNNGGFGQWLLNSHPQVIGHTAWACEQAGARRAADLVREVIAPLADPRGFEGDEAWSAHLDGQPSDWHSRIDQLSAPFLDAEPELLECAHRFARAHWSEVRTG